MSSPCGSPRILLTSTQAPYRIVQRRAPDSTASYSSVGEDDGDRLVLFCYKDLGVGKTFIISG